jgi:hypothetical protein
MQRCIQECINCYSVCTSTVHHCLHKGGRHAEAHHITLLLTCAEICRTSAHAMLLGAAQHVHTCRACAEICRACEQACRAMGDDPMMQQCADACRRCAESCQQMAGATA